MGFSEVLPVIIVVVVWVAIGLIVVAFFRRSLRIPTESEMEMEHEQTEATSDEKTPAATH